MENPAHSLRPLLVTGEGSLWLLVVAVVVVVVLTEHSLSRVVENRSELPPLNGLEKHPCNNHQQTRTTTLCPLPYCIFFF